jgi:ketosteroid isomerase-like protein
MSDARREQILTAAEQLTTGMEHNDADVLGRLYSPDAVIWHNTDGVELSVDDLLGVIHVLKAAVTSSSVTVDERQVTDFGFIQAQTAKYRFATGEDAEVQVAMFAWVDEQGRITRLNEYVDSAALAPLIAVIVAAGEPADPTAQSSV